MVFSLKKTNWGHFLHIKIYLSYIKLLLFTTEFEKTFMNGEKINK